MGMVLTKEQQKWFERNFNKEAYEQAKRTVQEHISKSKTFFELWDMLDPHDRDCDFEDDYSIIYYEVELDRSNMETDARYVGVYFTIHWNDDTNNGKIHSVALFSSDIPSKEVEEICSFHPDTCEVVKWRYCL